MLSSKPTASKKGSALSKSAQKTTKRSLSTKNKKMTKLKNKQQKLKQKSLLTTATQLMSSARTLPGYGANFVTPLSREEGLLATQHSRDIRSLQTKEDMHLNSRIVAPNNYVPHMVLSGDLPQAQAHTRAFYRKILRMLPALCSQYSMHDLNPPALVPVIRAHFTKHGEVTSPEVMDALRWEAEVEFSDIVRMFFTQTNTFSALFPDLHFAMLPKLPAAAAPDGYDPVLTNLEHNSSPFLENFLDPMAAQRQERSKRTVDSYHHI